ncbi:CSC1-like protein HYP1 [Hibiscus syriacus]|uniref:CSC1-like protein HYP1 n=1 Tax=Hibiscus syriacus TaxID=106335 RepID=UPI0019224528|nr:CSC1-like protein HYP1 [Hibiscus syriacus]XP_039028860.1 CSC1-like protein HYP1 [Hibiscus syriacus]XP_039028861.1 CSC1-like protein HYP1 [Hibiscus syriacus]
MILSALLTSVGINLGLCFLFFTLYSILRNQPGNITVYSPRLFGERKTEQEDEFNLERLLPSPGWLKRAWQPSEDELLSITGLDAVVLMRIFVFCVKVFIIACVIGIFILLPVNFGGSQLTYDFSNLPNKTLESFSISNVNDGSNRLWIHFCAAYVFTVVVCCLLYYEYNYISSKRIAYFYSSKPQSHQFTILVRGIPAPSGSSFSEVVDNFFMEYHPSTYLSHTIVRRTSKIQSLMNDAEKLYKTLGRLKSKSTQQRQKREGFLGLFGRKVDIVDHYEKKLEDIEDNVRLKQSSLAGEEVPAAFVSFKSRFGAAIALHIQQGINPTEWVTEQAPEPKDVYWPFFSASFMKRWIFKIVVVVAFIAVTILFLIPVVVVQGLTHLDQLETWLPFLKGVLSLSFVSNLITGYLPSLILQSFLSIVPPIMILFSSMQGYISNSQIEKSACIKLLWFTVWNIFFANVLSGSALSMVDIFLEPKKIPGLLGELVPAQASFFIAYVVTSGWTSVSSELLRLFPLLYSFVQRLFAGKEEDDDDFEVPSIPYHSEIPRILFFQLLGVTYFFLAPLILPFLFVYYCLGYIIYRNQFLNVYAPKFESGGKFWPIVHDSTIFSLVLMHVIAIGIFGLKKLPLASSLTIPLPVLTLIFNAYCRKRFLPTFKAYPTECLIKKDRKDLEDPTMTEFLEKLATAYQDPATMPVRYSRSDDGRSSPLLQC